MVSGIALAAAIHEKARSKPATTVPLARGNKPKKNRVMCDLDIPTRRQGKETYSTL
jgi:hypothetical protein